MAGTFCDDPRHFFMVRKDKCVVRKSKYGGILGLILIMCPMYDKFLFILSADRLGDFCFAENALLSEPHETEN